MDGQEPDFAQLARQYGPERVRESAIRFRMMCHKGVPRTLEQYEKFWLPQPEGRLRGEVSPTYFHDEPVAPRIKKRFPDIKLIITLRQPVDRAYSHFIMDVREGWVPENDFIEAIRREPVRIDRFWWGLRHYVRHGLYAKRAAELLELFDRSQILIQLYDDLKGDAGSFLADIFRFLGVDHRVEIDTSQRYNQGLIPGAGQSESGMQMKKPPPLPDETRSRLTEFYHQDILALQDLIEKDLSAWLSDSSQPCRSESKIAALAQDLSPPSPCRQYLLVKGSCHERSFPPAASSDHGRRPAACVEISP